MTIDVVDFVRSIPVGKPECDQCGGCGFVEYDDIAGRCECMPDLVLAASDDDSEF
jgi:hypothetical protein